MPAASASRYTVISHESHADCPLADRWTPYDIRRIESVRLHHIRGFIRKSKARDQNAQIFKSYHAGCLGTCGRGIHCNIRASAVVVQRGQKRCSGETDDARQAAPCIRCHCCSMRRDVKTGFEEFSRLIWPIILEFTR